MTSKLFAVLAVLMVVSQAVVSRPPAASLPPDILLPDYGKCLDDLQCLAGYRCNHPECPMCADCPCPPSRCEPKGVETEPVEDHHIG
ncbi:hypothetical protein Ddc_18450 [Ditylenchus destructor]|nr:hypothetical protein Ddc_18450 [Ditylenchus destructor]